VDEEFVSMVYWDVAVEGSFEDSCEFVGQEAGIGGSAEGPVED